MSPRNLSVLIAVVMSVIGVVGDYYLKRASAAQRPLATPAFIVGLVLYASTAFAWVFVMKHLKLATISVIYSISMILLLTGMGVFIFGESLSTAEAIGILLAIGSILLLAGSG